MKKKAKKAEPLFKTIAPQKSKPIGESKKTKPISFRIDPEKLALARSLGFDLNDVFRETLDQIVEGHMCPMCKRPVEPAKPVDLPINASEAAFLSRVIGDAIDTHELLHGPVPKLRALLKKIGEASPQVVATPKAKGKKK